MMSFRIATLLVATVAGLGTASPGMTAASSPWLAAYLAPQQLPKPEAQPADLTVRELVRLEAAGSSVRVMLSNETGIDPLSLDSAHVALADAGGALRAGTDRALTFNGSPTLTLAPGQAVYSDPVTLKVSDLATAAVTVHYATSIHPAGHVDFIKTASGNHVSEPALPGEAAYGPAIASRIEVRPSEAKEVLVTVGDSITDGYRATPIAHKSYPEQLADRLAANAAGRKWSVVDAGISGNRILHDVAGPSLEKRFDRDVLSVPGVRTVILLEGVNDLGFSEAKKRTPEQRRQEEVSVEQVIDAYQRLIARAHARGLRIVGATILPYKGANYWAEKGEAKRAAINAWIRAKGHFDATVDFDQVMRDPAAPLQMQAAYDSGDHLHPNDAGYKAMADAVPLATIAGSGR